jgi:hypothetical protein
LRDSVFAASARDCGEHSDAVVFGRERLGFMADEKQELVLRAGISRGLLNCTRQWGKSTVVAVKAVHHAFTLADRLVVVCSPSLRQSGLFCRIAAGMLRKLGVRVKGTSLELPNGSRIVGLPANDDTVRGYSGATMLLIDEAARVPDAMYAAVKPMLATTSGEMWLMSTPHGKRGFFYKEWMDAQVDWERICVTGAECGRIKDSYLEEERRSLGDLQFRQEYGCEFLDDDRAVFPTEWVDEAFRPWAEASQRRMGSRFYVCVDLGQLLDPTAVAVLERWDELTGELNRLTFEQTKRRLFAVRWLEKMPLQTSYVDVVERIFSLVRQWKQLGPCAVVVDATGVGAAVLDMLRQQSFSECRLVPVVFTGGERDTFSVDRWHVPKRDLMQGLAVLLEGSGLQVEPRLPEGEALRRELRQVRWEISDSGRDLFGGEKEHDDLVMAVALGVWWGRRG